MKKKNFHPSRKRIYWQQFCKMVEKPKERRTWRKRHPSAVVRKFCCTRNNSSAPFENSLRTNDESPKILSALHNWSYNFCRPVQPFVKYFASFVMADYDGFVLKLELPCRLRVSLVSYCGQPAFDARDAWPQTRGSLIKSLSAEARFVNVKPSIPSNNCHLACFTLPRKDYCFVSRFRFEWFRIPRKFGKLVRRFSFEQHSTEESFYPS